MKKIYIINIMVVKIKMNKNQKENLEQYLKLLKIDSRKLNILKQINTSNNIEDNTVKTEIVEKICNIINVSEEMLEILGVEL